MSTVNGLIILCLLACASLVAVSMANSRVRKQRQRQLEISTMKRQVQQLEELVLEVDQLLESRAVAILLNDEILRLVARLRELAPRSDSLEPIYQAALVRADSLAAGNSGQVLDRMKESDAQIARARKAIDEAAMATRRLRAREQINAAEMSELLSQLSWAQLMVDTISNVGQGHKSINRGNTLTGQAFYRKAQGILMHSAHNDPRRHRFIKELSELMANKRSIISTDLMPESRYNPEP